MRVVYGSQFTVDGGEDPVDSSARSPLGAGQAERVDGAWKEWLTVGSSSQ
jgi:hypothetical protein